MRGEFSFLYCCCLLFWFTAGNPSLSHQRVELLTMCVWECVLLQAMTTQVNRCRLYTLANTHTHTHGLYHTQLCYFHCYYPICIIRQLNYSHQRCPPLIDTHIWRSWKAALLLSYLKMLALISTLLWVLRAKQAEHTHTFSLALLSRITFSLPVNRLPVFLMGDSSF